VPLVAAAIAGLIRGRVPRLDGGDVKLLGMGRGGVVTTISETGSLFSSSETVDAAVKTIDVVSALGIVKIVEALGLLLVFWVAIFCSNNARR